MTPYLELEQRMEQAVHFITKAALSKETYPGLFLLHSIRVGLYLQAHGYDETVILAGFLHDVVEDKPVTLEEVKAAFGDAITELVVANTHNMELPRLERDADVLARCLKIGRPALLVHAADKRDNLEAYLQSANPAMMDWLKSMLKNLLEESRPIIGSEPVWQDVQKRYESIMVGNHP